MIESYYHSNQHQIPMAVSTRYKQLMKDGISFHAARIIVRNEICEAFYKEAEEQGCSWYEIQMLRKQDRLIRLIDDIHDHLSNQS